MLECEDGFWYFESLGDSKRSSNNITYTHSMCVVSAYALEIVLTKSSHSLADCKVQFVLVDFYIFKFAHIQSVCAVLLSHSIPNVNFPQCICVAFRIELNIEN